jgi:hypothetical protein
MTAASSVINTDDGAFDRSEDAAHLARLRPRLVP